MSQAYYEEVGMIQCKRARLELEKSEIELKDKKLDQEAKQKENEMQFKKQSFDYQKLLMEECAKLSPNGVLDPQAKLLFRNNIMQLSCGGTKCITNGDGPDAPLTISKVAAENGRRLNHGELIKAGIEVKKLYVKKYNQDPPKRKQMCEDGLHDVCSYTERDRDLVESVIRKMK